MIGMAPVSKVQTLKGHYSEFPALRHMFPCDRGAGTYALKDVVGGVELKTNNQLVDLEWLSDRPHSIYPAWDSEVIGHNCSVESGGWYPFGQKNCVMMLCGRLQGFFSVGLGDSVPHAREITMTQAANIISNQNLPGSIIVDGSNPEYLDLSFPGVDPNLPGSSVPQQPQTQGTFAGVESSWPFTDWATVVRMTGGIIDLEQGHMKAIYTDSNGDAAVRETRSIKNEYSTLTVPSDRFSMGGGPYFTHPDYDTWEQWQIDDAIEFGSGIHEMFGWAIFCFEDGVPDDVPEAMAWMRKQWIVGRKVIWPAWKGLT